MNILLIEKGSQYLVSLSEENDDFSETRRFENHQCDVILVWYRETHITTTKNRAEILINGKLLIKINLSLEGVNEYN